MCKALEKYNQKAREEGLKEGVIAGQLQKAKEIAIEMQKYGMPLEQIVKVVKYPKEEVERWLILV